MAHSYVVHATDGVSGDFAVPFSYMLPGDVEVRLDNIIVPYTFLTAGTIRISPTPAGGRYVTIRRVTPLDRVVHPKDIVQYTQYCLQEMAEAAEFYAQVLNGDSTYDVSLTNLTTADPDFQVGAVVPAVPLRLRDGYVLFGEAAPSAGVLEVVSGGSVIATASWIAGELGAAVARVGAGETIPPTYTVVAALDLDTPTAGLSVSVTLRFDRIT